MMGGPHPSTIEDVPMPQTVAERTPDAPVDLQDLGARLLDEARAESGHAAITLTPGTSPAFHQTVVALSDGRTLHPDRWNGPATLVVLDGTVAVSGLDKEVTTGEWARIADDSEVVARGDTSVLLTVVLGDTSADTAAEEPHLGPKEGVDDRTRTDLGM